MEICTIETKAKTYPVVIGDCYSYLISFLKEQNYSRLYIVTDEVVAPFHLKKFQESIDQETEHFIIPSGEKGKSFSIYHDVLSDCLKKGLDRKSAIIALGGGVVGDLAGFVAATYMRGIAFIQVPTTILAHDSAVGGKVGINHELGKNMIGSFYQPEGVFYHIPFLDTLPIEEVRSGFAEVIKHSLLSETPFFEELVSEVTSLERVAEATWQKYLLMGIKVKAKIVSEDEKEQGVRAYLNLGHTFGHAIEKLYGYRHGEAVAIGMIFTVWLSEKIMGNTICLSELTQYIQSLDYPTLHHKSSVSQIMEFMKRDKKSTYGKISFVILESIGKPAIYQCTEEEANSYIQQFLKEVYVND